MVIIVLFVCVFSASGDVCILLMDKGSGIAEVSIDSFVGKIGMASCVLLFLYVCITRLVIVLKYLQTPSASGHAHGPSSLPTSA